MGARRSPFRADLLREKVALVTGGATGLGLEVARVLGSHGARVAICSRKEANLQAAVAGLRQAGIEASYGICDVRRHDEVTAVVEEVLGTFGQLDIVVNNAPATSPPRSAASVQTDSKPWSTSTFSARSTYPRQPTSYGCVITVAPW
jgi:NAD(P)-dependent dehydrogenase (short-subunit alcohol dehydrogenase family)